MSRKRSRFGNWLQYLVLRYVHGLVRTLPWHTARTMASGIGDLIRLLDGSDRKANTAKNLHEAFPEMTTWEVQETIKKVYRHLPTCVVDAANFIRFAEGGAAADYLQFEGVDRLPSDELDTGMIFVTGHLGCWEVLGPAAAHIGHSVYSLARPLDNPLLDEYVQKLREAIGQHILNKKGSMQTVIRLLREGENIGFLIDQDARHYGIFVDFFGKPASTVTSPARLAIYTGAPLAFFYAVRMPGKNLFRVVLEDLVWPRTDADTAEETYRITQRLTNDLENVIRKHPTEWLWLHRRWRTYPGKYSKQKPPRPEVLSAAENGPETGHPTASRTA